MYGSIALVILSPLQFAYFDYFLIDSGSGLKTFNISCTLSFVRPFSLSLLFSAWMCWVALLLKRVYVYFPMHRTHVPLFPTHNMFVKRVNTVNTLSCRFREIGIMTMMMVLHWTANVLLCTWLVGFWYGLNFQFSHERNGYFVDAVSVFYLAQSLSLSLCLPLAICQPLCLAAPYH